MSIQLENEVLWSESMEHSVDFLDAFNSKTNMTRTSEPTTGYTTSPAVHIMKALSLFIILLVSLVGNILILLTIARDKSLHTKTSVFVGSLAIADLFTAVTSFSFMFVTVVCVGWKVIPWYCELNGVLSVIAFATSMLTLGCIAIDRYHLIINSLHYATYITKAKVTALVTWTWSHAIILSLLPLTGWTEYTYVKPQHLCTVDWEYSLSFSSFVVLSTFSVPLGIMGYCYYHIFKTARDQQRRVAVLEVDSNLLFHRVSKFDERGGSIMSNRSASRAKRFKRETKAAVTILVVIGTFVICWLPFVITSIMIMFGSKDSISDSFFALSSYLICVNSACNPIIYGIMNKQFRTSFVKYLCCISGVTHATVRPANRIDTISQTLHNVKVSPVIGRDSIMSFDSAIEMESNIDITEFLPPSVITKDSDSARSNQTTESWSKRLDSSEKRK